MTSRVFENLFFDKIDDHPDILDKIDNGRCF